MLGNVKTAAAGISIAGLAALGLAAPASQAVAATRAAGLIGAYGGPTESDWASANSAIGPLQTQRIFYSGALPASYTGSVCASYPAGVTCVISYKTMNTNVASFVGSIPASRDVILIWHHEPENDTFSGPGTNGQNFVSDFESQSRIITAGDPANVQVAMTAEAYQYDAGTDHTNGVGCSYIPPNQYVNFYFIDIYENPPNGKDLPNAPGGAGTEWNTWLGCVQAANNANPHPRKALGIAEYGLNNEASDAVRAQTLQADSAYLKANFPNFALWEPWDFSDWQLTGSQTIAEWKAIEAGTG